MQEGQEHLSSLPSVMALAYLGDAVYSLYIRQRLVEAGISHAGELNRLSLSFVTATAQAETYRAIEAYLTEWEKDIARRAHNHKGLHPPKHASGADYRTATGFEALLGALRYTENDARLAELLALGHKGRFDTLPTNS